MSTNLSPRELFLQFKQDFLDMVGVDEDEFVFEAYYATDVEDCYKFTARFENGIVISYEPARGKYYLDWREMRKNKDYTSDQIARSVIKMYAEERRLMNECARLYLERVTGEAYHGVPTYYLAVESYTDLRNKIRRLKDKLAELRSSEALSDSESYTSASDSDSSGSASDDELWRSRR